LIYHNGVQNFKMHPTQTQNAPRGADSSISESFPKKKDQPKGWSFLFGMVSGDGSKDQMQVSGGDLLDSGWTESTP